MKLLSILAVLLAVAAQGATILPETAPYQPYMTYGGLGLGVLAVVFILLIRTRTAVAPAAPPPPAQAARPVAPAVAPARQAEAEIVSLLGAFQAKGRLVDFLMDDINAFTDAQVGAGARVVHAGCRAVLQEYFAVEPICPEKEGARVQVPVGYGADEYRLTGKISGQAPFTGTLVHHGWKTAQVKLPRVLLDTPDRLPAIAPAEVELT